MNSIMIWLFYTREDPIVCHLETKYGIELESVGGRYVRETAHRLGHVWSRLCFFKLEEFHHSSFYPEPMTAAR